MQFLKRHPKLRSLQSNNKTGTTTTPVIALGPPPPPPQPEATVENNQFKSSTMSKNKMNSRNKASYWDNGSRDDWPLVLLIFFLPYFFYKECNLSFHILTFTIILLLTGSGKLGKHMFYEFCFAMFIKNKES